MRKNILWRVLALMGTLAFVFAGCSVDSGSSSPSTTYYTVTFNSNGGTAVDSQSVPHGTTAKMPGDPTYGNRAFLGWYDEDDNLFMFATPITADITLTAKWGEEGVTYYAVTFKSDGEVVGMQRVKNGECVDEPNDLTKTGYTLSRWLNEDGETFDFGDPITKNITLVAEWDKVSSGGGSGTGDSGTSQGPAIQGTPSAALPQGTSIAVKEANGWLNSAYVVFEQVAPGITYEVTVDGKKIDDELIRYYDTYTAYTPKENATTLAVTYDKKTYSKVVRADALGLEAGPHEIKIYAVGTDGKSDPTSLTATVVDHDRSGFAFTGSKVPGAYNKDGTLKDGATVIYLTQGNKATVKATIGGTSYTGIQAITQAIKTKNTGGKAVAIRVIGTVRAENNDLSCADHKSSYALGVKEASEVTIEGVGHDATLYGAGVAVFKSSYIEVANLGLMKWGGGKDGDGIALKGGGEGYIWVHNNDVFYGDAGSDGDQVKGDGSMDLKDDTKYVTIAYNHFWDSGKMSLCGMKSESGDNFITYHHNWFDHSDSRHPRIRTMTVHIYNNYFDGNAKYGVGVTYGASAFVESNYFRNAHNPMMSSMQGTDARGDGTFSSEKGGIIKAYNNKFEQNNTNGVKFQYISNKYDWTNDVEVVPPETKTETFGTANSDGTYTLCDAKVSSSADTIKTCGLIEIVDASYSSGKYQTKGGMTGFKLKVPSGTTKITVAAKCGSSGNSGTADMLRIGSETFKLDMDSNKSYVEYTATITVSADSTIEVKNIHSKNAMNVNAIKVIADKQLTTTYTVGTDLSDIDAYEVDNRSDKVPADVKTRSGGTSYNNFDTTMGNSGLGLSKDPTEPEQAKKDVLTRSGRHNSDFVYTFDNSKDDASYAKNDALNNALVAYKTELTATQGKGETTSGGSSSGSGSGTTTPGGNTGGSSGSTGGGSESTTPLPEGVEKVEFKTGASYPAGIIVSGNYDSNTGYLKMETGTSIKITVSTSKTLTIHTNTASKKIKIDGTNNTTDSNGEVTVSVEAGKTLVIEKGDVMILQYILFS